MPAPEYLLLSEQHIKKEGFVIKVEFVRVVTLNVGQGMCNIIEIHDVIGTGSIFICDCGSKASPDNWNGIDCYFSWASEAFHSLSGLFISHKDQDHVNKLALYLRGFNLSPCLAYISSKSGVKAAFVRGLTGIDSRTGSTTRIHKKNILHMPDLCSSFDRVPAWPFLNFNDDVDFYVVGAGMSAGKNSNDNCLSIAVSFMGNFVFLPGDSTGVTFANLEQHTASAYHPPLFRAFTTSAPHHGSKTTMERGGYSAHRFSQLFSTDWVEASAYDQFKHPDYGVLRNITGGGASALNHCFHVFDSANYTDMQGTDQILTNFVERNRRRAACYCFEMDYTGATRIGWYDAYAAWRQNPPVAPPWNYNTGLLLAREEPAARPVPTARRDMAGRRAAGSRCKPCG